MLKKYHFKEIGSTNDAAKELLQSEDLILAYADFQTKGRGRNENKWFGNHGENIYCSFGIRHKREISINQVIIFQAIGALITAKALRETTDNKATFKIKYPNDVMALMTDGNFGKISGVLAEHSFQGSTCTESIVGIGVNINQEQFSGITMNTPTSLKLLLNQEFETKPIIDLMSEHFIQLYNLDYDQLLNVWRNELNFADKAVKVKNRDADYIIIGLQEDGTVQVKNLTTNEVEIIDNGDSIRYDLR